MVSLTSPKQKSERAKTRFGVAKRIMRVMRSSFAMCAKDIARIFNFSIRHTRRYLLWLENDGLIYRRYRHEGRHYFSVVRKKDETGRNK